MIFLRIIDDVMYSGGEVAKLGFNKVSPLVDYHNEVFIIFRNCHGIGDWGIVSAMPRLIKQKYPNSTVVYPSKELLSKLFNPSQWGNWSDPFNNPG